jgi:hypothetical protein
MMIYKESWKERGRSKIFYYFDIGNRIISTTSDWIAIRPKDWWEEMIEENQTTKKNYSIVSIKIDEIRNLLIRQVIMFAINGFEKE